MLSWLLPQFSRLLDWMAVLVSVMILVYICQKLVSFFDPPSTNKKGGPKEE